jgi:hypothetical protein
MERQDGNEGEADSERDVRRRRREAVVIHDGEGMIGSGDEFMRGQEAMLNIGELGVEDVDRESAEVHDLEIGLVVPL